MELLAVTGDKGNGIALVQQLDNVGYMAGILFQLLRQNLNDGIHRSLSFLTKTGPGCPALQLKITYL